MVDDDGTVIEYVPPNRRCSHAYRNNTGTIGISFVGGGRYGPCNSGQYGAIIELCKDLAQKYPSIVDITGHKHVDPRGWKIDPRFAGEPPNGIDWKVDRKWMLHIAEETGLTPFFSKRSRKNK
jgi:N-acetyl-anhydromuramyl-L-alanine amidase AmpD